MRLTEAQQHNLDTIKLHGGTVLKDRGGFRSAANPLGLYIRGMNAVAVRSLVKLGLCTADTSQPKYDIITIAKRT